MALSAWVDDKRFELGEASFLKAWFSTIFVRLENQSWGSSFPTIMLEFYQGSLPFMRAGDALQELNSIRQQLRAFPPDLVVWDFENPAVRPPWGDETSSHIVSLGNYFVTSDGKDLCEVLTNVFTEAAKTKRDVVIT